MGHDQSHDGRSNLQHGIGPYKIAYHKQQHFFQKCFFDHFLIATAVYDRWMHSNAYSRLHIYFNLTTSNNNKKKHNITHYSSSATPNCFFRCSARLIPETYLRPCCRNKLSCLSHEKHPTHYHANTQTFWFFFFRAPGSFLTTSDGLHKQPPRGGVLEYM